MLGRHPDRPAVGLAASNFSPQPITERTCSVVDGIMHPSSGAAQVRVDTRRVAPTCAGGHRAVSVPPVAIEMTTPAPDGWIAVYAEGGGPTCYVRCGDDGQGGVEVVKLLITSQ